MDIIARLRGLFGLQDQPVQSPVSDTQQIDPRVAAQYKNPYEPNMNRYRPTPTPTPEPYPTPTLLPNAPENPYMDLLKQYFPPDQVNNASNIMFRESSYNHRTIHENPGGTKDYGLFQVNDKWQSQNLAKQGYTIEDMLDAVKAIQFAAWLQSQQGWNPWATAEGLGLKQ